MDHISRLPTEMILKLMHHVIIFAPDSLSSFSNIYNFSRTNKCHFSMFNSDQFKRTWKDTLINKIANDHNIVNSNKKIVIENEIILANIMEPRIPMGYCETTWKKENMVEIAKKYPKEIPKFELEQIIKEQLNFNDDQVNNCFKEYESREKYECRWLFSDYTINHHSTYNDPNNFHKDTEILLFFKGNDPYHCNVYDENIDNINKALELVATIIILFIVKPLSNYHFSVFLPCGKYPDEKKVSCLMRICECCYHYLDLIDNFDFLEPIEASALDDEEDKTEQLIINKYKSHWMNILKWYYVTNL